MVRQETEFRRLKVNEWGSAWTTTIYRLGTNPGEEGRVKSCRPLRSWSMGRRSGHVRSLPDLCKHLEYVLVPEVAEVIAGYHPDLALRLAPASQVPHAGQ
jgi:hypothetical protein